MKMPRFLRRVPVPGQIRPVLETDETVLSIAEVESGQLAVTRYGIWFLPADEVVLDRTDRIGWETVSKAHWDGKVLGLTIADVVGTLGGAEYLADRPRRRFVMVEPRKVTDIIHTRTRAGIVSSTHHALPGGSGWVVLRKIPGRDGLVPQVRLDPGTPAEGPEIEAAVAELVAVARAEHAPPV
ncbi:hypothetical protein D1871_22700 [Nakamurella silvestris]|nr:hypothetical protein D1871_22700 [Nakamurella silvestris]